MKPYRFPPLPPSPCPSPLPSPPCPSPLPLALQGSLTELPSNVQLSTRTMALAFANARTCAAPPVPLALLFAKRHCERVAGPAGASRYTAPPSKARLRVKLELVAEVRRPPGPTATAPRYPRTHGERPHLRASVTFFACMCGRGLLSALDAA